MGVCVYPLQIGVTVSDIAELRASAAREESIMKVRFYDCSLMLDKAVTSSGLNCIWYIFIQVSLILFSEKIVPTCWRHFMRIKTLTLRAREYNTLQKVILEILGFERRELGQPLFASLPEIQREVASSG